MKKFLLVILAVSLVSSSSLAEMKLKLHSDVMNIQHQSIFNKNIETNLKLDLPAEVTPPADMKDFVKGMIMLGILADVSFPMGDGFKHVAGTGFSGHVVGSYLVSSSFLIALRAGYITFGTQTEEGSEQGFTYKYEDTFSQIPILLGAYYIFATGSGFKPYLGAALGVYFQTYKVKWEESGFGYEFNLDDSFSNTGFGVVPAVGFYYFLGSVVLQVSAEYALLFSEGPTVDYSYEELYLGKVNGLAQDEGTYEESSDKPSYISVNLGVSFPLGK
jgi:opacity protein-like surface antigen